MSAPLYKIGSRPSTHSNVGLVFDKFFASWNEQFIAASFDHFLSDEKMQRFSTETKAEWVRSVSARGTKASPGDAAERVAKLAEKLGGAVWYAVATSRFVTGTGIANPLENGFAFHHTLGVPYLTASGLKGGLKSYWDHWSGDNTGSIEMLGTALSAGSVIFFDMLPVEPVTLVPEVMTPHYGEWYQKGKEAPPGDWMSPTPIPFIAVEAGAYFQIAVAPRKFGDPAWQANREKLKGILKETLDITGLGAKTAVGYGRFELYDSLKDAKAALHGKVAAGNENRASLQFKAGGTLPEGTALTWNVGGEIIQVRTLTSVILKRGITIPVTFDEGEDEAPISKILELKHIQ